MIPNLHVTAAAMIAYVSIAVITIAMIPHYRDRCGGGLGRRSMIPHLGNRWRSCRGRIAMIPYLGDRRRRRRGRIAMIPHLRWRCCSAGRGSTLITGCWKFV